MIAVNYGLIPDECFKNYFKFLIGSFYKILPTMEDEPDTLKNYLESLQIELMGNQNLIKQIRYDGNFLKLLGTIQYFIDNECQHKILRKEVFKCINIIKKLQNKYFEKNGEEDGN
jgi:hypothetical protein